MSMEEDSVIDNPEEQMNSENPIGLEQVKPTAREESKSLTLDKLIEFTEHRRQSKEELAMIYTEQQIQKFMAGTDAPIDDKCIMAADKTHLVKKQSPISLLNTLRQKEHNNFIIEEKSIQKKEALLGNSQHPWYTRVLVNGAMVGEGIDTNKKMSVHFAALNMLKNIFPKGKTWNEAVEFITSKQNQRPLQELLNIKQNVTI